MDGIANVAKRLVLGLVAGGCLGLPALAQANEAAPSEAGTALIAESEFTAIDGTPLPFSQFAGQPVLVVNTASECGFTPQFEGLQALWTRYRDRGLVVLGVPSNDFAGQEPRSEAEIQAFCELNFGVDFPLTARTPVVGPGRHAFYAGAEAVLGPSARPKWNFHKVLIGPDGVPLAAFGSRTEPGDPALIAAIESALAG